MSLIPNFCSEELFRAVVAESGSIAECVRKLELPTKQGHYYRQFHKTVKSLNISTEHFDPYKSRKTNAFNLRPYEEILVANSDYKSSSSLKKRLIKDGMLENRCHICNLQDEWLGRRLSLHLDHINGVNNDNRLENLRLLCPNCHSQTDTYCGKHRKKITVRCADCKKVINRTSIRCVKCSNKLHALDTKIVWPPINELMDALEVESYSAVSRRLVVSDNAIRKHLRKSGVKELPKRLKKSWSYNCSICGEGFDAAVRRAAKNPICSKLECRREMAKRTTSEEWEKRKHSYR